LRHVADPAPDIHRLGRYVKACDPGRAGAGIEQSGQDLDGGAFARAIGTQQTENLAEVDVEGQPLQRGKMVVALAQSVDPNGQIGLGGHGAIRKLNVVFHYIARAEARHAWLLASKACNLAAGRTRTPSG